MKVGNFGKVFLYHFKRYRKDITLKVIDEVGNQLASYPDSHDFDMSQTISYYLDSSFTDLTISMNPY